MAAIKRLTIDQQIPTALGANVIKHNAFGCSVRCHWLGSPLVGSFGWRNNPSL
jgi:hypothetical protein